MQPKTLKTSLMLISMKNVVMRLKSLTLKVWGGGTIDPLRIKKGISLEPNVILTSN